MAGITLGRRASAPYFRAAKVSIHKDKTVRCEVRVENTGTKTITANLSMLFPFYGIDLTPVERLADCLDAYNTWFNEINVDQLLSWETNDRDIPPDGGIYDYTIDVVGDYLTVGVNDAGLVFALDTDDDAEPDIFLDCILVKDAIEVVEAERWGATIGSPSFSEV